MNSYQSSAIRFLIPYVLYTIPLNGSNYKKGTTCFKHVVPLINNWFYLSVRPMHLHHAADGFDIFFIDELLQSVV